MGDAARVPTADTIARRLARDSRGLVLTTALVAAGVAPSTISRRVARDTWTRPAPRVVDVTGERWSWERRVHLAVLGSGEQAWASHRTAAALHDLPGFRRSGTIHVTTVRRSRSRRRDFRLHSTTVPDPASRPVDGIPTAGPVRTLLGLAAGDTPDRALHRATRAVLTRRLADPAALVDPRLQHLPGHARLVVVAAREAAHASLAVESPLEERAIDRLLDWELPPFVTQHEVVLGDRLRRFDVAWPTARVAVEVDGEPWHGDALSTAADLARDDDAAAAGWCVVRVRAADLAGDAARHLRTHLTDVLEDRDAWLSR